MYFRYLDWDKNFSGKTHWGIDLLHRYHNVSSIRVGAKASPCRQTSPNKNKFGPS